MDTMEELSEKIFALLKGNGLQIKVFDVDGNDIPDAKQGRRFFVVKPNIMVTIDEDDGEVQFNKGSNVNGDEIDSLQKNMRTVVDSAQMNFTIKIFGKQITPRDYAYQAKMQKDTPMMENAPVNSFILGKVFKELDYQQGMSAKAVTAKIPGSDFNQVQQALNRLVTDGKAATAQSTYGDTIYTKSMEEAIAEASLNELSTDKLGKYKTAAGADATASDAKGDYKRGNKRMHGINQATNKQFDNDKRKPTPVSENADKKAKHSAQLKQVMKHSAVKGQDNRDLSGYNGRTGRDVPRVSKFAFPENEPKKVQKKPMNTFGSIKESFSKMFGSLKTSQQTLENVRILVRHKTPIDENVRGSRSRHISAIFLECNGERFRFPNTYLPGARAMAQHMAHGGTMNDKVGAYISESTDQLLKLQSFNRYVTTNNLINEDSSGIVETVKENIQTIRIELKKLTGSKTYETVKARLETFEREQLDENDTTQLKELFTIRRFDEKFEEVLPIVKQLVQEKDTYYKRIEEAASNVISLRREAISTTPMFEFASENARLGFKLNELALRIMENDELAGFVGKIGTKLCKEGVVNQFEKAVLAQVLENVKIKDEEKEALEDKKEVKESINLEAYFDKFVLNMF